MEIENKEIKKSFYAVIPADVRYDEKLIDGAKLLYGEITALCNDKGYCWATNEYFAKLYKKNARTIRVWISNLKKQGYINIEVKKVEGTYRKIHITTRTKTAYPPAENSLPPRTKTAYQKNITLNNTIKEEKSSLKKNENGKPFYKYGGKLLPLRFSQNRWWVIPEDGGEWLEFAGKDKDIIYK